MAPIYDTDIAQSRWDKADWENYELWEKVEHRARKHRRLWIAATAVVFIALSSIPIVLDRWDKWVTLAASRRLAEEINVLKRDAGLQHAAFRLRFAGDGSLAYRVEKASSCADPKPTVIREGRLFYGQNSADYLLLSPAHGAEAGIPGLIEDVCYDYLAGSDAILRAEAVVGFGIIPAKDLADKRMDRLSILLVNGPSADPSFE